MGFDLDWSLAAKVAEKDGAVNVLNGTNPGNNLDAARLFAASVPQICELADDNTLCLIENVQSIRTQTVQIAAMHSSNPDVINAIKPVAERFNLDI